jgi:osmotically-inducible protein OsmY
MDGPSYGGWSGGGYEGGYEGWGGGPSGSYYGGAGSQQGFGRGGFYGGQGGSYGSQMEGGEQHGWESYGQGRGRLASSGSSMGWQGQGPSGGMYGGRGIGGSMSGTGMAGSFAGAGMGEMGGQGFEAERRRNVGRGPKGYQRSDERIREEISDQLMQHPLIDASDVEIEVQGGEVTLKGNVEDRNMKRMLEDLAESVLGVKDVHNHVRAQPQQGQLRNDQQRQGQLGQQSAGSRSQHGEHGQQNQLSGSSREHEPAGSGRGKS